MLGEPEKEWFGRIVSELEGTIGDVSRVLVVGIPQECGDGLARRCSDIESVHLVSTESEVHAAVEASEQINYPVVILWDSQSVGKRRRSEFICTSFENNACGGEVFQYPSYATGRRSVLATGCVDDGFEREFGKRCCSPSNSALAPVAFVSLETLRGAGSAALSCSNIFNLMDIRAAAKVAGCVCVYITVDVRKG